MSRPGDRLGLRAVRIHKTKAFRTDTSFEKGFQCTLIKFRSFAKDSKTFISKLIKSAHRLPRAEIVTCNNAEYVAKLLI